MKYDVAFEYKDGVPPGTQHTVIDLNKRRDVRRGQLLWHLRDTELVEIKTIEELPESRGGCFGPTALIIVCGLSALGVIGSWL